MAGDERRLVLYTTSGCHLCEEAHTVLEDVLSGPDIGDWCLSLQDIAEDARLMEQYGIRIPVVRRTDTGEELGWPFGHHELLTLLRSASRDPSRSSSSGAGR